MKKAAKQLTTSRLPFIYLLQSNSLIEEFRDEKINAKLDISVHVLFPLTYS